MLADSVRKSLFLGWRRSEVVTRNKDLRSLTRSILPVSQQPPLAIAVKREVLGSAGYATALIGKWHLTEKKADGPGGFDPATMPNAQGFDFYYGTPLFNGFTVFVDDTKFRSPIFRNEEIVVEKVESWDHITQDYTREALAWIENNRERPFFLYLAHNLPHIPVGASERFKGNSEYGPYGDTIEEIDWSCGEIVAGLKKLGLDENTLIVFTSDNGPWVETTRSMEPDGKPFIPRDHSGSADPLRGWKMSAWDGGSRVPCIVRWPGTIPAGSVSDELLTTMDLLPTFAILAGADLPERELDGRDASSVSERVTSDEPPGRIPLLRWLPADGCTIRTLETRTCRDRPIHRGPAGGGE
jgi:arylsulfatase A-like enzyme